MFQVEEVGITAYLINKGPLVQLNYRILKEVGSDKEVIFSFFKVFGYVSYIHIDFIVTCKYDTKSKKYIFYGYVDIEFGYFFQDGTIIRLLGA